MKVVHYKEVKSQVVSMKGADKVQVRMPISIDDGAITFIMRVFEFEANGKTPYHRHDYEHEVFVIKGSGAVLFEGGKRELTAGEVVFVLPMEWHSFIAGPDGMEMLCLVPKRAYEDDAAPAETKEWTN